MTDSGFDGPRPQPSLRDRAIGLATDKNIHEPFSSSNPGIPVEDVLEEALDRHYRDFQPRRNSTQEIEFQTPIGASGSLRLIEGDLHVQTDPTDIEAGRGITVKGAHTMEALSIAMTLASVSPSVFERVFPEQREVLVTALEAGQFETSVLNGEDITSQRYAFQKDGVRLIEQNHQGVIPKEAL